MSERGEVEFPEELRQQLFPNYPNEQQIDRFFATLGRAVSAWQLVETSLYLVYEAAIQPQAPGAAASAFHAIQTFNVKLSVTDATVRFVLLGKPALLPEWKTLRDDANTKSMQRNKLVHFSTYVMVDAKNENDKIRLEPPLHDYRHAVSRKKTQYRITDIAAAAERFRLLSRDFRLFAREIFETPQQTSA
jgi:hypothetical protein